MSTQLVIVERASTIAEAATLMGGRGVGSALVVEDGETVGIFTERDVLRALASDFDAARHTVEQWMTAHPTGIDAGAPVGEARALMLRQGYRHLPVTEGGALVGIVSIRDLANVEG